MEKLGFFSLIIFVCLVSSVYSMVAADKQKKSMVDFVNIPGTTTKPSVEKAKHFWCKDDVCDTNLPCKLMVRPTWMCCPTCACVNQFGMKVKVGDEFRMQKPGQPCYICKCERRFFWEEPATDCREIKCPFNPDLLRCKKKLKPAGSCCEICTDKKEASEGHRPKFPEIPEFLLDLKKRND